MSNGMSKQELKNYLANLLVPIPIAALGLAMLHFKIVPSMDPSKVPHGLLEGLHVLVAFAFTFDLFTIGLILYVYNESGGDESE